MRELRRAGGVMIARQCAARIVLSWWIAAQLGCAPAPPVAEPQPASIAVVQQVPGPSPQQPSSSPSKSTALASDDAVIQVCEAYRKAMEARDSAAVLALASPAYHDDAGTADPSDDIDYNGLRTFLQTQFRKAEQIRYEMKYVGVRWEGGLARVAVTYSAGYKISGQWIHRVDSNELVLEQRNGSLLFVRGL